MNEQSTQQNNAEYSVTIPASRKLWKYLLQGQRNSTKKLSRVQAFYDLIERQHTALLKGEDSRSASIIELTKAWHWNRDTVAKFLDNLQQLGAVTLDTDGNRKKVRLNCVTHHKPNSGASQKPSDTKTPLPATNMT